jgi:hypothetical protein
MYSFAQRADTTVVDEPLYAHYLRVSGADHPGREDVLASQDPEGDRVVSDTILGAGRSGASGESEKRTVVFFKQMAHHLIELDRSFLAQTANVLLVRDPREMLPSLTVQIPGATLVDTGLAVQSALLDELVALGQDPPVLDTRTLLQDPEGILRKLCDRLALDFEPSMLRWSAGARPEDGVWAAHWYQNVHRSTGFQPYSPKTAPFPANLEPLLAECRPHYERLLQHALRT